MIRRNIFIYLLVAAVFISGNGIVFAIHICFSSSTKTISLFEEQSCKSDHSDSCHKEESDGIRKKCCLLEYSYYKLDLPSDAKKFNFVATVAPTVISTVVIAPRVETNSFLPTKEPPGTIDIPIFFSQLLI